MTNEQHEEEIRSDVHAGGGGMSVSGGRTDDPGSGALTGGMMGGAGAVAPGNGTLGSGY